VQLKAFLMPAQVNIEGKHIILNYPKSANFHFNQVEQRKDSLLELIHSLYGDDIKLSIHSEAKAGKKKPLTLTRPKAKATKPGFIEPKSKKTVVENRLEPEQLNNPQGAQAQTTPTKPAETKEQETEAGNKTIPPETPNQEPTKPKTTGEKKPGPNSKSQIKDIKPIAEFPDDIPPDFWDEQEELSNIEELSNYNQTESFESAFEADIQKDNAVSPTAEAKEIVETNESKDKTQTNTKLNNKNTIEKAKKAKAEEKLEVSYPLFAEVEKLFPGKIIKIEPKTDS